MSALAQKSIHAWIQENRVRTESGAILDFRDHLFWFDVLSDFSPEQVWYKCAQVGGSTVGIVKSFYAMHRYGLDAIYTLPTANDVKDFVGGKVNRIIANNPVLQSWIKEKDSVESKTVENNQIYYRGTWTERAAIMVSSDLNIYDEIDRSKQDIIEQYASRLQHSKFQWQWSFSNPSVEGNGVSKLWPHSDQKHWFVRCGGCNKRQFLSWPESIDEERREFICKHCHKALTREERRVGEWVKKYKDRRVSGYWFSLLMAPWVTADKILTLHETKSEEYFHNFVLGLPYVGGGNKVQKHEILQNVTDEINMQDGRVIIGVDTGAHIHYCLGNRQGVFHYGESDGYEEIEGFLRRWPKSIAVFDQGGDLIAPRKLREKYKGRVFLCHYRQDRKTMEIIRWGEGEEDGNVLVDRNRMIELAIGEFRDRRVRLHGTENDWYDFWLHWDHIYRTQKEDALGVIRRTWERSDADHWVHAYVYMRVGMDRFCREEDGKVIVPEKAFKPSTGVDVSLDGKIPVDKRILQMPDARTPDDWRNV